MNPATNHLVADISSMPEEMRSLYTPLPTHLADAAARELDGRREAYVNPNKRTSLAKWAAKKRKQARAKAKMARASRRRNRAA